MKLQCGFYVSPVWAIACIGRSVRTCVFTELLSIQEGSPSKGDESFHLFYVYVDDVSD